MPFAAPRYAGHLEQSTPHADIILLSTVLPISGSSLPRCLARACREAQLPLRRSQLAHQVHDGGRVSTFLSVGYRWHLILLRLSERCFVEDDTSGNPLAPQALESAATAALHRFSLGGRSGTSFILHHVIIRSDHLFLSTHHSLAICCAVRN